MMQTWLNEQRAGRLVDVLSVAALAVVFFFAALLVYESFFYQAIIDPANYASQHIYRVEENERTNLALVLTAFLILRLLNRVRLTRRFVNLLTAVVFSLSAAFAVLWTLSAKAIPYSDQGILIESAKRIIANDLAVFSDPSSYLYGYFIRYPYQFGFLAYTELLMRVFGYAGLLIAGPVLNVGWLFFGYIAVLKTTRRLFSDENVACLTMLLLAFCTQQLLACTFYYGTIPCTALAMWSVYFIVDFLIGGRKRSIPFACVFGAFAVVMKSNAWICLVALAVVLTLAALRSRRFLPLLVAALLLISAVPLPIVFQEHYEHRNGVLYGKGYPLSAWMSMSMQESSMACGWYNGYMRALLEEYGTDTEGARAAATAHIRLHLERFAADPAYAHWFFEEKFYSQWTETTYMSVWVSKTCETYGEKGLLAETIYREPAQSALEFVQKQYMHLLFFGSCSMCSCCCAGARTQC